MKINALCTANAELAKKCCDELITTCKTNGLAGMTFITEFESADSVAGDIYLPDMLDEQRLESACDYLISNSARAVVRAAYDLNEAGMIEARYKLSPIMLLHKLGVLDLCTVAGGVCLDNDDLDLMAQENVPLIVLPTADAGYGHGFAPICAAVRRGIRVGVGTFDGKYNANSDLDYEIGFLRLVANATMSAENSLSSEELRKISAFE